MVKATRSYDEYPQLADKDPAYALRLRRHLLAAFSKKLPDYFVETFVHYNTLHDLVVKVGSAGKIPYDQDRELKRKIVENLNNEEKAAQMLSALGARAAANMGAKLEQFTRMGDVPAGRTQSETLLSAFRMQSSDLTERLGFRTLFFDLAQDGSNSLADALADPDYYYNHLQKPGGEMMGKQLPLPLTKDDVLKILDDPTPAGAQLLTRLLLDHTRTNPKARQRIDTKRSHALHWQGLELRSTEEPQRAAKKALAERAQEKSGYLVEALCYLREQAKERNAGAPYTAHEITEALTASSALTARDQEQAKIAALFGEKKLAAGLIKSSGTLVALANLFLPIEGTVALPLPDGTTHTMGLIAGMRELEQLGMKLRGSKEISLA